MISRSPLTIRSKSLLKPLVSSKLVCCVRLLVTQSHHRSLGQLSRNLCLISSSSTRNESLLIDDRKMMGDWALDEKSNYGISVMKPVLGFIESEIAFALFRNQFNRLLLESRPNDSRFLGRICCTIRSSRDHLNDGKKREKKEEHQIFALMEISEKTNSIYP